MQWYRDTGVTHMPEQPGIAIVQHDQPDNVAAYTYLSGPSMA